MAETTDRRNLTEESSQESRDAANEWHAPTLTLLGDAVPLTMGAAGATPDGPGLKS